MAALNPNEYAWIIPPTSQFLDVNGKPLVGGYCVIYIHGTTGVPYTTYQNWEGTENPIEIPIDIIGHAPAIGSVSNSYDLYVYDSLNSLVYSRLNLGAYGDEGTFSIHTDETLHGDGSVSNPLGVEKPEVIGGLVRGIVPESDNVHVRTYQYLSDGSIMIGLKVDETEYQAGPGIKIEDHTISLEDLGEFEGSLMVAEGSATSGTDLNTGMSVLKQEGDSIFVQQNVLKLNKGVYHVDAFIKFGAIVNANEYDLTFLGHNGAKLVYTFDNTYEHTEIINFSFDADITEDNTPLSLTLNLASAPGSYSMKLEAVHIMKVIMQSGIGSTEYNAGAGIEIDQSTKTIYANFNQVQKKLTPTNNNVTIDSEGNISVMSGMEEVELTQAALTARFETIQGLYGELESGKEFLFVYTEPSSPNYRRLYYPADWYIDQGTGHYVVDLYSNNFGSNLAYISIKRCLLDNSLSPDTELHNRSTMCFMPDQWIGTCPNILPQREYVAGEIVCTSRYGFTQTWPVELFRCILGYTETGYHNPHDDTTHWEQVYLADLLNEFQEDSVQSDWNQTDSSAPDYIKNKPNLTVDQTFQPTSTNAQSGVAVAEAMSHASLFEAVYGTSTFAEVRAAINDGRIVFARVQGSSANTYIKAFLAYYTNSEIEFQYVRSVPTHTASSQGDQVRIYKLTSSGWTTTVREMSLEAKAGNGINRTVNQEAGAGSIEWSVKAKTNGGIGVDSDGVYLDTALKSKLDGIETGAEKNVQADWNESDNTADDYIKNKPDLSVYARIADLAAVAFSGDYDDLANKPDLSVFARSANLAAVAFSGSYSDLTDKPTIPTKTSDLQNDSGFITASDIPAQTQSDWNETNSSSSAYIRNKPDLALYALVADLAAVAFSGDYTDLSNKPDLSVYALSSSLATVATSGSYGDLSNKPDLSVYALISSLATVATTGDYTDLSNKPDLSVYALASSLSAVATSGDYNDLSNKPTIPTITYTTSQEVTDILADLT